MDCLKNIIGISQCPTLDEFGNEIPSIALININQLPGISIESIDSIADSDYDTYLQVYEDILTRAAMRLSNDIPTYLPLDLVGDIGYSCYGRLKHDADYMLIPNSTYSPIPTYGGIGLGIRQSQFLVLNIPFFRFFSPIQQVITFYIKEAASGSILWQKQVAINAGENIVDVNLDVYGTSYQKRIFLYYDLSGSEYYETTSDQCYYDCDVCGCDYIDCSGIRGASSNDAIYFQGRNSTFGLSVTYNAYCDFTAYICNNRRNFLQPMVYATMIEYYKELIGSSRLNRFTKTNAERNKELYDMAVKDYEKALKNLAKFGNITDSCCFKCNEQKKNMGQIWSAI